MSDETEKRESYEDVVEILRGFPATWYPALLQEMVTAAYKKNVFIKDQASVFISQHEKRIDYDKIQAEEDL